MKVSNWTNYPVVDSRVFQLTDDIDLNGGPFIARGNGRCYGDASLYPTIASSLTYDKVLHFDREAGVIRCQSGILLSRMLEVIMPAGWFLPVTPGTKFITLGGAVASDVHGKNHHVEGAISNHVSSMVVLTGLGELVTCNARLNPDLFWATCGGMGLTGVIFEVTLKLKKVNSLLINSKEIKARDLREIIDLYAETAGWNYSVAWIDCVAGGRKKGRSILMLGEHDKDSESMRSLASSAVLKNPLLSVPFYLPSFTLNSVTSRLFNFAYYSKSFKKIKEGKVHYDGFFYPLDFVLNWNRVYGKKGFVQYQFVIPEASSYEGLNQVLTRIQNSGFPTYLAVLKLFGEETGLISFPMRGFTLALDLPIRNGLFTFLDELDRIVADFGGRIYLSKDARMKSEIFWKTYPKAAEFKSVVEKYDPKSLFKSNLAARLLLKN